MFSWRGETGPHQIEESRWFPHINSRIRPHVQPDHRRSHCWRRAKAAGRHVTDQRGGSVKLSSHRQHRHSTRTGQHAFGNFLLHHYHKQLRRRVRFQKSSHDRIGCVVGQISHDFVGRCVPEQRAEIYSPCVALGDMEVGWMVQAGRQRTGQLPVHLHRNNFPGKLHEFSGKHSQAGPYFQDQVIGLYIRRRQNPPDDTTVVKEMLAEGFSLGCAGEGILGIGSRSIRGVTRVII